MKRGRQSKGNVMTLMMDMENEEENTLREKALYLFGSAKILVFMFYYLFSFIFLFSAFATKLSSISSSLLLADCEVES